MVLELALLVLNVSLVLLSLNAIVHPQTTKRQVRELIEQAGQRWKASRPLRAKRPTDCPVCCGQGEASGVARPGRRRTENANRGRGDRRCWTARVMPACVRAACTFWRRMQRSTR